MNALLPELRDAERSFAVTFDYLCPFARNAHESIVAGIRAGRPWSVRLLAFSLNQVHVPDGEPSVWDRPSEERGSGVLALTWGIAVRDRFPDHFLDFHLGVFAARHDQGRHIRDESVLRDVASTVGLDASAVADEVASGRPLDALARDHSEAVERWQVFGVPTFIDGDKAVFVRLMDGGRTEDIDRILDLLPWTDMNEFKRTRLER